MIDPLFLKIGIGVACVSFLVGVVLHKKRQKDKGRLQIELDDKRARFGEPVSGRVVLECKKDIEINKIVVSLTCYLRKRHGSRDNGSGKYTEQTIYRAKKTVADQSIAQSGETQTVPFEMAMPDAVFRDPTEKKLKKHFIGRNQRDIRWEVTVNVDCKGVDLKDKQRLVVAWIEDNHLEAA